MRIAGTIEANLMAAVKSARQLRGRRVHPDTITFWRALIDYARRGLQGRIDPSGAVNRLVAELEGELATRPGG